ncbi:hypothetical protein QCD60_08005 [Pokkaliibacter sp. MBI-7]|uniref:hypothetical protein n=1 Tax=Pokkaliibacter sp. MBI-7 TaxID=3040600 RepID=UPI00244A5599|nr:hypothetical protein [Pokkaliibacter sp. MBI-7]MDH2432506.1 hypothetical protein [Pokkaliibacter sp. MBI-7]
MTKIFHTALAFLFLAAVSACGQASSDYPSSLPGSADSQPEDQGLVGPVHIADQWQVFKFSRPMTINRQENQNILIGLDPKIYTSSLIWHIKNTPDFRTDNPLSEEKYGGFGIRKLSDGELIEPDIELIGDNKENVPLKLIGSQAWPSGAFSIKSGLMPDNIYELKPINYPETIKAFVAFQVRSNVPLDVDYFIWRMDDYAGRK